MTGELPTVPAAYGIVEGKAEPRGGAGCDSEQPSEWISNVPEAIQIRSEDAVARAIDMLPPDLRDTVRPDAPRQVFALGLVDTHCPPGGTVMDIGGGTGFFTMCVAALGRKAVLVDDFGDDSLHEDADYVKALRGAGVEVLNRDVIALGLGWPENSVDLITSFDSMEHWHASPKALFAEVMTVLRPGGWFLLGVPNAHNLRKRIETPLGRAKWSQMADWYEKPVFRGHVREPDVADLRYIAADMGLTDVTIMGRNWQGLRNPRDWIRKVTPKVDSLLQRKPSLCSDLYILGRKN